MASDKSSESVWLGFEHVEDVFIFGVPMPGATWTEGGNALNWVGHLLKYYTKDGHDPLVFCYAVGGDTVDGVRRQIRSHFLRSAGLKPSWAPWTSELSLFVTWVGINDVGWGSDAEDSVAHLFELQEELYNAGARNFLFVDVPPVYRYPTISGGPRPPGAAAKYQDWNAQLRAGVERFREAHSDVSAFIFSAHALFSRIMDEPETFGFKREQVETAYSDVWVDHIHPRSAVHRIIAKRISEYLYSLEPRRRG